MTHQITRLLTVIFLLLSTITFSQSVGIGTETPNSNAILELVAPNNDQGLLVPRMTTAQRTATTFTDNLSASDNGLMVYDQDENKFFFWINDQWIEMSTGNLNGLPDQSGQSGKFLTSDGIDAAWTDLDFNSLINIPSDLADGDDNTQLSDADITAFGYIKDPDDPDADPTNENQTVSAGAGISVNQVGDDFEVTNSSPDQTVTLTDGGSGNVDIVGSYPNFTLDVVDIPAADVAVTPTVDLSSSDVQAALEELQGEITAAASAAIPDGAVTTPKLGNLAVTNAKVNDVDFSKLTSVPAGLADGDDVNDADSDPNNEDQTVSAGTGISINQVGDDFEVTNTSPDQTVSLTDGGNVTVTGTYPNFTLAVPNNLDNDPANEDQTVSAGTGISVNNVGDDYEVTNTSPDQTVSLTDGGNVTVTGTYPNFTLAVPNNLDNDPTNEDQTVSAGTGISVNNVGDDYEVTNTAPDQTVSLSDGGNVTITGTYPNFTLAIPTNLDNSTTNEIELPTQTGQNGNFLTTDGSDPSWSSINETQWITNGTSINYSAGNVNIGSGTIPPNLFQLSSTLTNSTTPQFRIYETDGSSDASINLRSGSTNFSLGVDGSDDSFKISGFSSVGNTDRITIDNTGAIGIGASPFAKLHIGSLSSEAVAIRVGHTYSGAASMIGLYNIMGNEGSSLKTGVWNSIDGTASSTQQVRGVYNVITPTDGTTYGVHSQVNSAGTGVRYGTFSDVRAAAGNASNIYGFRANMDHDGSGDSFGFQANMLGTTSGRKYGIYTSAEDFNYFEGNVGIGDVESDVELTVRGFTLNSTMPVVRLETASDAAISYDWAGGVEFMAGVDATDNYFKISAGSALGTNDRMVIDLGGNMGINQPAPSARLDVVGSTELNGAVDVQSTLDVTGQLTVTNDIEIPETSAYTYASAQTREMSYHPSEFKQLRFSATTSELVANNFTNQEIYFTNGGGALGYATAPVKLPDGAVVTEMVAYVLDNDATAGNFVRVNLYESDVNVANSTLNMAQVETSTESASVQTLTDNTIFSATIDNSSYSYRILFTGREGSSTTQLHGVRITYTVLKAD